MPGQPILYNLGTIQHPVDQVIIPSSPSSAKKFLTINAQSETADIWTCSPPPPGAAGSPGRGNHNGSLSHFSPLSDPTSSKRPSWSHERHCAPLIDISKGIILAMSPQVLNQRDTIRVFRLHNHGLAPHTSIRLSSERPVNMYRYHLQDDGVLLIAANEGEQDDDADEEDRDQWDDLDDQFHADHYRHGVLARILICNPTSPDSPIQSQLIWHRKEDPFFDSMFLLPTGAIIATESHYNLEHNSAGVTIHIWDFTSPSRRRVPLTAPFRSVNTFPMLLKSDEAYLASEVACSILTSTSVILCVVESTMDVLPGYNTHQAIIRSFDFSLKETWCAEPILGTVSEIKYVPSQNALVAFGAHNESRKGTGNGNGNGNGSGVPDWALTVTVIDAHSGRIRREDRINYKSVGRRRVACSVEDLDCFGGGVPSIVVMFDDGTMSFTPLERFVEDGFNGIEVARVVATEKDSDAGQGKVVRGAIGPGIAVLVREGEFTAVGW